MGHSKEQKNASLLDWRKEQEVQLKKDDGWLTVVGLLWLKSGQNTIGSAADQTLHLPKGTPAHLATLTQQGSQVQAIFATTEGVRLDGNPIDSQKIYLLRDDQDPAGPSQVKIGSVQWFLIRRKNGVGVRVKDQNAEARLHFKGRRWFDHDPKLVVEGKWNPLTPPKTLLVPDIIGNLNEEKSSGFVSFEFNGQSANLYPTDSEDSLFFVFRDQTSGQETYGAGRFLTTPKPRNGVVTLDFNRAVNPPCAFTHFATCPIPPSENKLSFEIRAGELKPDAH